MEPEEVLSIKVLEVDMMPIFSFYMSEVEPDTPYSFEGFNRFLTKLLNMSLECVKVKLEEGIVLTEEEAFFLGIMSLVTDPSNFISVTTTTKPGRLLEVGSDLLPVPLILQVESLE